MQNGSGKKKGGISPTGAVTDSFDLLLKPVYEYVLSSVETVVPVRKTLDATVEAPGYITYDARRTYALSSRYAGRIERLYVTYPYQAVRKGQRILDLYSPEMAAAQQDLVFLLENDPGNTVLIGNARRRLSLLGMTDAQIRTVEQQRKPELSLPLFSAHDGLVVENTAPMPATGAEADEQMDADAAPTPDATRASFSLREGMYVQKGQRLFSLQSLASVWAILELYPSDVAGVKTGQAVRIRVEPFEQEISGKIGYIEPQLGSAGKSIRARVYLDNPGGRLKPGALLKASVQTGRHEGLWIPAPAVLDLGREQVVFVKKSGIFQAKKIKTGARSGNWLELRSGISASEEIAANAQFLMDSESFVQSNGN